MNGSESLLKYKSRGPVKLVCEVDLNKLLPTQVERKRFDEKWESFLASDETNPKIFKCRKNILSYESEQLIPAKTDNRPPLLLVLGNPASHSVHAGMFFAFEGDRREHRFWTRILRPAGILELPDIENIPVEKKNRLRRKQLLDLHYDGPFRIGLCVFISMPSAPGGVWGGIAGVQKLIGIKALRRLEIEEARRIHDCAGKFIGKDGRAIVFQKNAWNTLRSGKDPVYSILDAKSGALEGSLKDDPSVKIYGVPPTRLAGPCKDVLKKIAELTAEGK
jgi:hypothetical protein